MNVFYLDENLKSSFTAGFKAPSDIAKVCERLGYKRIEMPYIKHYKNKILDKAETLFKTSLFWMGLGSKFPEGSVLIYQHPTLGKRVATKFLPKLCKKKGRTIVGIIHDVEFLRGGIDGLIEVSDKYTVDEVAMLKGLDYIICHNDKMKAAFVKQGISEDKLVSLKIFDYLTECPVRKDEFEKNTICVAGNLAPGKAGYIYDMFNGEKIPDIKANLYGVNYEDPGKEQMIYKGSFKPDEVPGALEGSFGLVWDGNTASTCGGKSGEYLRFNNPHKTSLYLASGIPVIVWKEAAMADFVSENQVGIAVKDLYEIGDRISELSDEEYKSMKENAINISSKLRRGFFFEAAIKTVLGKIESK